MTFTKLANMFNEKGRRTRAMGTNTVTTRGRTATAVIAATLTIVLAVDPFGVASVLADPPGAGDLSRSERVDAVIAGLDLDTPVTGTTLTGEWDALPDAGELPEAPADLPTEDEQVVVLSGEGEGGFASYTTVSYRVLSEEDPEPTEVDLGGMSVTIAEAEPESTPEAVRLRVAGEAETEAAGVTGVLLEVTDASEETTEDAEIELTVSYADFAGLGGGDWASRLRIVWIPDCDTEAIECRPVPLETVNDVDAQTVTATVPVGEGIEPVSFALPKPGVPAALTTGGGGSGGSLAVTAGASGSGGNWGATSLSQAATWGAGGSTGGFTWSLPFNVPTTAAGPVPKLGLSYSSSASDGRTPNSNNQSGLVGEGFDVTSSYVERSYVPCSQDEEGSANNVDRVSGDQCWGTENATLSFNGSAVELVHDVATDTWHPKKEDGSLVEKLTGAWNGGQANEYWKVTTTDGTQYFFGRGQRSATDTTPLNSAWTVPVYGNHSGEPCYHADFSDSRCNQVWRWNLEYVVDPSGNSMTYFYSKETNSYVYDIEGNHDGDVIAYNSGGRLDRIEYGTREGSEGTGSAPAKVTFTTSPRCITDLETPDSWCSSTQTSTTSNNWLDTPIDLICNAEPCTNYSPVFFDRYRLNEVSTSAYDGSAYQPVDSWTIQQRFVAQGTGIGIEHATGVMLVASGITHTGQGGTTATGDDLTLPPHQFGYTFLVNRVDEESENPLWRPRISNIRTDSGAWVSVNYRTECTPEDKPGTSETAQQANTKLCYPVKWREDGANETVDYFHKYVVESLVESGAPPVSGTEPELITGSVATQTVYTYVGGAAWAKPTGAMVKPSEMTYSDFRGFGEVITTVGLGSESSSTKSIYFRGMGGNLTAGPSGYTVTAEDTLARRGQAFDTVQLDGTSVISETIFVQGETVDTATDAKGNKATRVPSTESFEFTYRANGTLEFRTGSKSVFDSDSQVVSVEDLGDRSTSADNVCTTTTYAHTANATLASKRLLMQVSRSDSFAGSCSGTPSLPADLLRSTKATFDDNGRPLKMETIDPVDGDGYILASEILEYDQLGRTLRTSDPLGGVTTVSYEESDGGLPESSTSTTPDPDGSGPLSGFVSSTTFNPLTGRAIETADINGRVTSATYDALGRLLTVRYPQHQASTLPSVAYEYAVSPNGLNSIVTKTRSTDGTTQHVSAALYDGMLRLFQTQVEGKDAGADHNADAAARGRLVSQTYYDSAGRIARQTGQWFATGAPAAEPKDFDTVPPSETTFEYDGAGRTIAETFFVGTSSNALNEKWSTTTTYDGATTLRIPPLGDTPQEVVTDAHGRTVELREYLRDPDVNAAADLPAEVRALAHQSTTYTFDVAGRMTQMQNPEGKVWSYVYDWNGSQTSVTDPDAGTSSTTYDVAGQVLTRTNGNGETLAYTYDGIGRKTEMKELHEGAPATLLATWAYDDASFPDNDKVLGQLSSETRHVGGAEYTTTIPRYDDAYRPLETTVSLPDTPAFAALDSRTFTTAYSYTTGGQIASVSLPAVTSGGVTRLGREVVTTRYDTASQPSWMSGGFGWGTYVAESRFTSDGRPLIADLGNTYGAITSYQYEDGTNRLLRVALDREGYNGTALDIHYGYDSAGNMTSMLDQPTAAAVSGAQYQDNQCFGYDGLRRLQVAWTAGDGDCAVAQGDIQASDIGGVQPYWTEYEYDKLGNRTKLTEHGLGSALTATTDYEHGGTGAGPHQLTQTTKTVGSTDTVTNYTYDDAGNRVSAGAVDYEWDAEGELTSVDGDENVYDASGNRLVRSDASGTTVYLPGGQEIKISGTTVSASRYYQFAGSTVATRTGSGLGAVTSLVSDQHGSVVAAVPNTVWTASSVTRVFSDPFGAVRGGSDAGVPGDHRFLGAVSDAGSGLTLLGARYYDPGVGTFISVDPLLDTGLTAQFNAYVYSGNNPLTWSDPSGMDWWGDLVNTGKNLINNGKKWLATAAGWVQRPPTFKQVFHWVVANPVAVTITQDRGPVSSWISANLMGFKKDPENGNVSSTANAPQLMGGYQPPYDSVHQATCDTAPPEKFEFSDGTTNYVLWAWKGDYLQLGAGAEIGFYREATKGADGWYDADGTGFIPMMTVNVRGPGGEEIADFAPPKGQHWVYESNPSMQGMTHTDLDVTVTVDLSGDPAVLAAFEASWGETNPTSPWTIENGVATLKYRRRKKWVR